MGNPGVRASRFGVERVPMIAGPPNIYFFIAIVSNGVSSQEGNYHVHIEISMPKNGLINSKFLLDG